MLAVWKPGNWVLKPPLVTLVYAARIHGVQRVSSEATREVSGLGSAGTELGSVFMIVWQRCLITEHPQYTALDPEFSEKSHHHLL